MKLIQVKFRVIDNLISEDKKYYKSHKYNMIIDINEVIDQRDFYNQRARIIKECKRYLGNLRGKTLFLQSISNR